MEYPFQDGGALVRSKSYIERAADQEALETIHRMQYLLLIESRGQGKTSLVNRLIERLPANQYSTVLINFFDIEASSEEKWYRSLCERLVSQLVSSSVAEGITHFDNYNHWRNRFLHELGRRMMVQNRRAVIVLDEIGKIQSLDWAEHFASGLRSVFDSRGRDHEFGSLTFVLCGNFNPRSLVRDPAISPFTVSQRVRLPDFTLEQVRRLVDFLPVSPAQAHALTERIYYWTDGQPYLTQRLCLMLTRGDRFDAPVVDTWIDEICQYDEKHLASMLQRLHQKPNLLKYVKRIASGHRVQFNSSYWRPDDQRAHLELIGIIKNGPDNFYIIRNRLYAAWLQRKKKSAADGPDVQQEERSSMATQEDIRNQQERLKIWRASLALALSQLAAQGGPAYATSVVMHNIQEGRNNIRQIKGVLRHWGETVPDHPDDEAPAVHPEFAPKPVGDMSPAETAILLIFSNPRGTDQLRLQAEERVLRESINLGRHRDRITLTTLPAATVDDARRALLNNAFRVVQFSGHGSVQGLLFENAIGERYMPPPQALAELLKRYSPPLECVILNACYTKEQGQQIADGVPYTIWSSASILDEGAIEFTRGFYDAMGAGKSITSAYEEGCITMKLKGFPNIPALFTKTSR